MKVADCGPYEIHLPTSGGKAGKGRALTCSLQVRRGGVVIKQFRFSVDDPQSRTAATQKAKDFMREHAKAGAR